MVTRTRLNVTLTRRHIAGLVSTPVRALFKKSAFITWLVCESCTVHDIMADMFAVGNRL
jgi:hypothetical protein